MGGRPVPQNYGPVIGGRMQKDPTERLREQADAQRDTQRKQEEATATLQARIDELEAENAGLRALNTELEAEVSKLKDERAVGQENAELEDPIQDEDLELDKKPALAKQKPAPVVKTNDEDEKDEEKEDEEV